MTDKQASTQEYVDSHLSPAELGRVAVLMGGDSAEREISLLSGNAVLEGLRSKGVEVVAIDVGRDLVSVLNDAGVDRVFNILHGRGGEDGQVQGLLEMQGIPYTGSGVLGSAISMDKAKSKLLWRSLGLSTPRFKMLDEDTDWTQLAACMPLAVIKPVHEGSSIGMSLAETEDELRAAYATARGYDSQVMAEQYIRGKEFSVPILGDRTLPTVQLKTHHRFYDYDAKYLASDTKYTCPAELSGPKQQELDRLALDAFNSLGCEGWGRVDVMQDDDGRFWLLEVNTVPGMTDHSLIPMAAREEGLDFGDLLLKILSVKKVRQRQLIKGNIDESR